MTTLYTFITSACGSDNRTHVRPIPRQDGDHRAATHAISSLHTRVSISSAVPVLSASHKVQQATRLFFHFFILFYLVHFVGSVRYHVINVIYVWFLKSFFKKMFSPKQTNKITNDEIYNQHHPLYRLRFFFGSRFYTLKRFSYYKMFTHPTPGF